MRLIIASLLLMTTMTGWLTGQQTPGRQAFFAFFGLDSSPSLLVEYRLDTRFTLANPGPRNSQVAVHGLSGDGKDLLIQLFGDLGGRLPISNPFQLNGRSSINVVVSTRSNLSPLLGWVRIDSSEPITALEHVDRTRILSIGFIQEITTLATVAIPPSIPVREFTLSVVDDKDWFSGISIAVADTSGVARNGVLTLLDGAGQTVASRPVSVSFTTQIIKLGTELFPQLETIKEGTILGQFDGDVIVTSLKFSRKRDLFTLNLVSGKTM